MIQSLNAVLIVDKPQGFTSHDVVARVRRIFKQKSVGHLGTLDPLATGVLPLVLGNFTRLAQFYLASEKTYEGIIRFGFATDTYDSEGEPVGIEQIPELSLEQLRSFADRFRGVIEQLPPRFSAKKIQGIPAYKLARKKKETPLQPVQVEVKEFEITHFADNRAHFRARVGSGTYMRSIAHDVGQLAGCGAHLESLRRTSVAEFTLADAHALDELEASVKNFEEGAPPLSRLLRQGGGVDPSEHKRNASDADEDKLFIHPRKLLPGMPSVTATDEAAAKIRHGQAVNLPELSQARQVKVFQGQRRLICIATRVAGTLFHPRIVLG